MKQKLIDALKTEYKSLGLSDNTIGRLADYILGLEGIVKEEADISTAVKRADVALVAKSIQGEIDGIKKAKETAEAALADYKAKHPEGEPKPNEVNDVLKPDLAKIIADSIAEGLKPLQDKISALETSNSAKEALTTANAKFFGGDYAKKYKEQAEEAWERAVEMNEATGSKMTADELAEKASGYFNKSVSRIGVDTSKPFVADPSKGDDEGTVDWSAEKKRKQEQGLLPKEKLIV